MTDANPFVRFVASRLKLDVNHLPDASQVNDAGNTFGAICVRLGLLDIFQIDAIVEAQRNERHRRFGELAVHLGYMTESQVQRVLGLQQFYRSFEQGTLLVLAGHLDMVRLIGMWVEYASSHEPR